MESKKDGDDRVKERRGSFGCAGGVLFESVRRRNAALTGGNIEVLSEDKGRVDFNSFEESFEFAR